MSQKRPRYGSLNVTGGGPVKKQKVAVVNIPAAPALSSVQRAQVARLIRNKEELKVFQAGIQNESIGIASGSVSSLANIVQGVATDGRIGDEIAYRYLKARFTIVMADATQIVRVIFFKWHDNTSYSAPTYAKILKADVSGIVTPLSFYNDNEKQSYSIIYDQVFTGTNGTSNPLLIQHRELKFPVKGKARYTADAGTDGTNKLYRLMISDSAGPPNPTVYWMTEVGYTDA